MNLRISPSAAEIDSLNASAWNAQYTDPVAALKIANRCIDLSAREDYPYGHAYALLNKGFYELRFCPLTLAEATLRDAQARFNELKHPRGVLLARTGLAGILLQRNEIDAAKELLESVINAPAEERESLDAYFALYRLGFIHFFRGEVEDGLRYYYRALALVQREHSLPLTCQALSDLGSAQMELANFAEARDLLERAFTLSKSLRLSSAHLIVGNLANVHLEMGNPDAALHLVEHEFPISDEFLQPGERAYLIAVAAQTYAALGRWELAYSLAEQALGKARADQDFEVINQSLWLLGMIARGMGKPALSVQWLLEAEQDLGEIKNVFYVLAIYRALAEAYADLQQFDDAYRHLKHFHALYEESLGAGAKARFFTLRIQHELAQAEFERDYALQKQDQLKTLNEQLRRKVEEVENLQAALREQAVRDPLTGLYNRRFFDEQIGSILNQAQHGGVPVSIVLLDLDHFKEINDTLGHAFGDRVLVALADLLRQHIRINDLAVRYGGEEFCLVFTSSTAISSCAIVEDLLGLYQKTIITVGEKSISDLTFSAGIAEFPPHGSTADALLQMADAALYRAKDEGRNRVLIAPYEAV